MGALILPSRFTQQPQQPALIDRGNPITQGVRLAINGTDPGRSIFGPSVTQVGAPISSVGRAGRYQLFNGTNQGLSVPLDLTNTQAVTVVCLLDVLSLKNAQQNLWEFGTDTIGTQQGFDAYTSQYGFEFWAGSNGTGRDGNTYALPTLGTHTISAIYDHTKPGGSQISMYMDGALQSRTAQGGSTGGSGSFPSNTLYISSRTSSGSWANQQVALFLLFDRALAPSEIRALSDNPWQVFKAPPRRLWIAASTPADTTLAGVAIAQASATGALSTSIRLTAGAAVVASATGSLSTAVRLAGFASAAASSTGALSTAIQLSGAASASASASGTLAGGAATLSGAAVANATATGVLTTAVRLAGAAAAQASASGALSTQIKLTGTASAGASASGALSTDITLSGAVQTAASASGTLAGGAAQLSGAAVASASAAGALATSIRLSGAATAQASTSGALAGTGAALSGAAVASASASGAMLATIRMTGLAAASASASGTLGTAGVQLSGSAVARAAASGALLTSIRLAGAALSQASAAGDLTAPGRDNFARAPDGPGYSPQRIESQARPGSASTARPANTQRNYR